MCPSLRALCKFPAPEDKWCFDSLLAPVAFRGGDFMATHKLIKSNFSALFAWLEPSQAFFIRMTHPTFSTFYVSTYSLPAKGGCMV
jgi:hypothetical protein